MQACMGTVPCCAAVPSSGPHCKPSRHPPPLQTLSKLSNLESLQSTGVLRVLCSSMPAMTRLVRPSERSRAVSGVVSL